MRLTKDDPLMPEVGIMLDGRDVTRECFMADDQAGVVDLILLLPWVYICRVHGAVVITLSPDAPESVKTIYLKQRAAEQRPTWGWPTWKWPKP